MEFYLSLSTTREMYVYMDTDDRWGLIAAQRLHKEKVVTGSGWCYKVYNLNEKSNDVVDLVEYHVDTLPQFKDIEEKVARE